MTVAECLAIAGMTTCLSGASAAIVGWVVLELGREGDSSRERRRAKRRNAVGSTFCREIAASVKSECEIWAPEIIDRGRTPASTGYIQYFCT